VKRELAKALKAAGFPAAPYRVGHRFFPHEESAAWPEAARKHGATVTEYELQNHLQDIKDGYYCPTLPDLIGACGAAFGRLSLEKDIWTARSKDATKVLHAHTPEEAVAQLWLALREARS